MIEEGTYVGIVNIARIYRTGAKQLALGMYLNDYSGVVGAAGCRGRDGFLKKRPSRTVYRAYKEADFTAEFSFVGFLLALLEKPRSSITRKPSD